MKEGEPRFEEEQFSKKSPDNKEPKLEKETPSEGQQEKKESTVDINYIERVNRFFNEARSDNMRNAENPSEEDLNNDLYLRQLGNDLEKLGHAKRLEKMQPKDISIAASYLLRVIASTNPEIHTGNEGNKITEEQYAKAKSIFMSACEKMFPDVKTDPSLRDLNTEIMALNKLGNWSDPTGKIEGDNRYTDSAKLLKEDPKKLSQDIDYILFANGENMEGCGKNEFVEFYQGENSNSERLDNAQLRLGSGVKSMYKIQLMRDELTKRIYGRTDITPAEMRQIDESREKVK